MKRNVGESEEKEKERKKSGPCMVFMDGMEVVCQRKGPGNPPCISWCCVTLKNSQAFWTFLIFKRGELDERVSNVI